MDELKKQLLDKLKSSNNILVTVGRDPSVDQLSALLGLTLFLNKQGKHAAAVFSGVVPPALEFLKPEETIEKDTNSLRDFIIALDKTKADKLRYKVEDDVVRIFITPYKTSISQDDFEFSQGDFNVDLVVAIGVQQQEDLDEAIVAHGRILHDATVASINVNQDGGIGTINWHMPDASSLSELVSDLVQTIDKNLLDEQIATAILTGIVAETDRFSNEKTTAQTMSASAALMAAGANQQLVASKLQEPDGGFGGIDNAQDSQPEEGQPETEEPKSKGTDDGTLEINHEDSESETPALELPEPDENAPLPDESDENEEPKPEESSDNSQPSLGLSEGSSLITEPPTLGGTLTSSTHPEALDPSTDPFSMSPDEEPKILSRKDPMASLPSEPTEPDKPQDTQPLEPPLPSAPAPGSMFEPAPMPPPAPVPSAPTPQSDDSQYSTLADLEESIGSSHVAGSPPDAQPPAGPLPTLDDTKPEPIAADEGAGLDAARDEVSRALTEATASGNTSPEPIQALNAQPMTEGLHSDPSPLAAPAPDAPQVFDPTAPPPVPPPIPFQFGQQPPKQ